MTRQIRLSSIADKNLDEIVQFYRAMGEPEKALEILHATHDTLNLVAAQPYSYSKVNKLDDSFRSAIVQINRKKKYKIFYKIQNDDIIKVLMIRYATRKPPTDQELKRATKK